MVSDNNPQEKIQPMTKISISPLQEGISFGARVEGVNEEVLKDDDVRQQLRAVFEERGLIVFANVEPTNRLQLEISKVFGPLKEHPIKATPMVDPEAMPGVIEIRSNP